MENEYKNTNRLDLTQADEATVREMIKRGASRREFLAWMIAAGATTAAAGSIFASTKQAIAATPKKGGRLVMAIEAHSPGDTLDPAAFKSNIDYFRGRMFYGSLVRLQDDLSYKPELAEEVSTNENATEWTFKLRKGVEFHNGKTMTADDVLYSMNRHVGTDSASTGATLFSMVDRWEKVNDYEVRAILNSPNADFAIALGTFQFKIIPDGWTDFANPVGTGPYTVKEFKPGVRCIGARFDNYWEDGGYLDELEHFAIPDPVARLNALLSGEIDAMANVDPRTIGKIESTDGVGIWALQSGAFMGIAARRDLPVSNNTDLIRTIQYLMDRERIVKGVLKGQGTLGNDQPIGPAYPDHCADIPQRMLDPDKAKYHFDKSGVGNTAVPIVVADVTPGAVDQALFLQREAQKIGLNIDVQKVSTDGYWSSVWKVAPFCATQWNMRPTANIMMSVAFASTAKWNESYWKNEQFDKLLVDVLAVTDPAQRKQMYCDMQTLIHETGGSIFPAHTNYIDGAADHVKGRTHVPLNNFGGCESPPFLWRDDA
ncbi:MAG: ABC transporter substrate-binding protein [Roseibium sp.]|uniref:ABC transporter substrate-binding protein n=1 Tax=Roseibium sp. TaxID=1936156 RepID=UPI003D9C45FF